MRIACAAALLLALPLSALAADPAPSTDALAKEIVARYRQALVLAADYDSLDAAAKERVSIVGRILFTANNEALEELHNRLDADLAALTKAPLADSSALATFLKLLEANDPWRDADKLAFRDLVRSLATAVPSGKAAEPWRKRLADDAAALQQIHELYEKEMAALFGKLGSRGLTVRREKWDDYLKFLRTLYTREKILDTFRDELSALDAGLRGGKRAPRKVDPLLIDGGKLPPMSLVISFDDGPHPVHTKTVLDTLAAKGVKGMFFELGKNVGELKSDGTVKELKGAELTQRLLKEGHVLANHTVNHKFLPKLSEERLDHEIDDSRTILEAASKQKVALFRPPYGARSEAVDLAIENRKLMAYLWNVDSLDWADPVPSSIADRVVQQVEALKRGVILMHDVHPQSAEALPLVLDALLAKGYKFYLWNGSEFIGDKPAGRGEAEVTPRAGASFYRKSHAVVVGINDYKSWPKLSYAVNDAKAVREVLVSKFLFPPENVTLLLDHEATRERILTALGDTMGDGARVQRDDRLFVFFAGHGTTRQLPNGKSLGYIVPVDADAKNLQGTAISMSNFEDISDEVPAKHIFFAMDACYSGLALTRGAAPAQSGDVGRYLAEVTRRTTREVLTAGGADEQVSDRGPNGHSIFTWTLLQGLEGRADLNGDGYVTGSELGAYVAPAVSQISHQTPAFGSLVGSDGGEFVLELNHQAEFLTDESHQLEEEAISLNSELDRVRQLVAEKKKLMSELEKSQKELASLQAAPAAADPALAKKEQAKRENDRGTTLYRERKYAEALAAFQSAAQLAPDDPQSANNVGFLLFKMGKSAESVPWLEKTVKLDPARAPAYVNLGDAYDKSGRTADAARVYRKYLELMPNSPLKDRVKARIGQLETASK